MRFESSSDGLENKPESPFAVNRDPSYPDRERIDSDVRAFLRPASSPWIVFDRDSRVDDFAKRALRLGKVFASSPGFDDDYSSGDVVSSVPLDRPITSPPPKAETRSDAPPLPPPTIDPGVPSVPPAAVAPKPDAFANGAVLQHAMSSVLPSTGVFPPSTGAPDAAVEPSNLVVAADVIAEKNASSDETGAESELPGLRSSTSRKRFVFVAGACAGVFALAGLAVFALGRGRTETPSASPAAQAAVVEPAAPVVDPPAPAVDLDQLAPPTPAPAATAEEAQPAKPEKKKSAFGKLTIKGEAKHKNVYFDNKRMLGHGQRSFLVFCGKHTIAVNDRANAQEVEIPCGGEYVVSK